jgi:hypothetical protein
MEISIYHISGCGNGFFGRSTRNMFNFRISCKMEAGEENRDTTDRPLSPNGFIFAFKAFRAG